MTMSKRISAKETPQRQEKWDIPIHLKHAQLHFLQMIAGAMDLYYNTTDLASNPKHTRWLSPLLLLADAAFCALIIWKIPCEICFPSSCPNERGSSLP